MDCGDPFGFPNHRTLAPMIKTLAAAAVLSLGLAGYAVAQETSPGAPIGNASVNAEPPGQPEDRRR